MEDSVNEYVHGYSARENERLIDQATTLTELLHHDTIYPAGAIVLEAGCGVGAQTITLVKNSPQTRFVCVDISEESLRAAQTRIESVGYHNATFQKADSITVIEGDHGSAYFHPESQPAQQAIQCLIDLQAQKGGDSLIGRRLFPLITSVGFKNVSVSPRMVYVDSSRPEYVEGFTKNTFTAMVEGVRDEAISSGMIDIQTWEKGIQDLYRTAESDGTFCYTFFKAVAYK